MTDTGARLRKAFVSAVAKVEAQAALDKLIAERDAETDKRKRKELSRRVKLLRDVRDWTRTHAT